VQHGDLSEVVAATLAAHASHLAQHWLDRALAATPRRVVAVGVGALGGGASDRDGAGDATDPDPAHAEQVVLALAASLRSAQAASLVTDGTAEAIHAALGRAPRPQDARPAGEVMRLGWIAGRAAFAGGLSVQHVVRDADLLLAVVLADVERALEDLPDAAGTTAAQGFTVARRLHRAAGRYGQAAVGGFVHALLAELRERYRLLRHDLRNPLGTIRSALSLMEDETVPAETRHGPGIRAMVARNAGSLDHLIALGLDDAAATALFAPAQDIGLRDVAIAARREVREAARLTGCDVVIDLPEGGASRVDGAALELTLTAVLLAALARAAPGATLHIALVEGSGVADDAGDAGDVLRVNVEPPGAGRLDGGLAAGTPGGLWDEHGLRLAMELARDNGMRVGADPSIPRVRDTERLITALCAAPTLYLLVPTAALPDRPDAEPDRL